MACSKIRKALIALPGNSNIYVVVYIYLCTLRSYTDSADPHNTTDTCPPILRPFPTGSGGGGSYYTAVKTVSESCTYSNNGLEEIEETTRISTKIRRIQNDGPEDDIIVSLFHVDKFVFALHCY
jgi:hypothetical protein